MQRMNAHVQNIVVPINQFYRFLFASLHINFYQSGKFPHTVVNVGDVVTDLKRSQFFECDRFLFGKGISEIEFMVTFKNLMIRETSNFQIIIDKTLMNRTDDRNEFDLFVNVFKNILETLNLLFSRTKQIIRIS